MVLNKFINIPIIAIRFAFSLYVPLWHITLPITPSALPETETWFRPWAPTIHPCSSTCPSIGCIRALYVLSYQICLTNGKKVFQQSIHSLNAKCPIIIPKHNLFQHI